MASATSAAAPNAPDPAADQPQPTRPQDGDAVPVAAGTRFRGVDHTALWRQVEAESARVVAIDLDRYAIVSGRMMSEESGERNVYVMPDSPLNRLFPGAELLVELWSAEIQSDPSILVTHSLSPRHWTYFWRVGPRTALLAAVRHRYGRGALATADTATIRLLCENWLAPELQAQGIGVIAPKRWTRVDRRARAAAQRVVRSAVAVLVTASAGGIWLATGGAAHAPDNALRVAGALLAWAGLLSAAWLWIHQRNSQRQRNAG